MSEFVGGFWVGIGVCSVIVMIVGVIFRA